MPYEPKQMTARLGIRGTFECRNAAGEVIKTIELNGAVPLTKLGLTQEQARRLVEQQPQPGEPTP